MLSCLCPAARSNSITASVALTPQFAAALTQAAAAAGRLLDSPGMLLASQDIHWLIQAFLGDSSYAGLGDVEITLRIKLNGNQVQEQRNLQLLLYHPF